MFLANLCCRPLHEVVRLSRCSFFSRFYTSVCQRGGSKRNFSSNRVCDASQWQLIASIRNHGESRADMPPPELPGCLHTHTHKSYTFAQPHAHAYTHTHTLWTQGLCFSIFIDLIGMTHIQQLPWHDIHTATHCNTTYQGPSFTTMSLARHRVYCLEFRGG